ncbi:MAG: nucleoside/nucleotide kinase family protein [Dermatophilaceae bacterium]
MSHSLAELAEAATALVPTEGRAVLGIAGAPGAGKTTLATALVAAIAERHGTAYVAHLPMDGFHLADAQLDRLGLRDRKGAPETFDADGYAALLQRVRVETGRPVYAPGFERTLEQPLAGAIVVPAGTRLVITEGNYLLLPREEWRRCRAGLDATWWLEVDDEERRRRLVVRHIAFGKDPEAAERWVLEVDEANAALLRASGGPETADLVIRGAWD